jgi:hypothetical protein
MLPKGKVVFALLLPRNHGIRHPDARQSEILRAAQDDSAGGAERRVASRRSCVRRLRVNSAKDLALVFAWKGRTEARCFAAVKIAPILG